MPAMSRLPTYNSVVWGRRSRAWCALATIALLAAAPADARGAQQHDPLLALAAQNAELSDRIALDTSVIEHVTAELAARRKSRDAIDTEVRRLQDSATLYARGGELARTVAERLRVMPKPGQFRAARDERRRLLRTTSDAALRDERRFEALGDLDGAVATRVAAAPPLPEADRPRVEAALRELLVVQRDLLARVIAVQQKLMQILRETGETERDLERRSKAARAELHRLVFWMPAPPGIRTITELDDAIAWTLSPANWRAAGMVLRDEAGRSPVLPVLALLIVAGLLAGRGWLRRRLVALAPPAVTHERYRFGHALEALAATFALALPVTIAMATVGILLASAPDTQRFAQAAGDTLLRVSPLPLAMYFLAWLLDRRGLGVTHFGWDEASLTFAARALRRFTAFFVPFVFVTGLNLLEHAPYANRESLGRLGMNIAMLALAGLFVYLFRRKSPLTQRLAARAPRSWAVRLHPVWFTALVAVPLAIVALAAVGYFIAAAFFFARILYSLFLVLAALTLYGLIALWVQLRGRQHEAAWQAAATLGEASSQSAQVAPPLLDIAAIGEQTRALLDLFTTLLLLGGLWLVWKDAMPLLSAVGDYALWTHTETVNGKTVTQALTVGNLGLAIVIGAVTAVAVRNVGALLDIVLLQRITIQADATYAIKVMARYTLAAAGVLLASSVLGIGWNDVQWLVAALSVGLGFGLQEIFANFVSGIIILAERPIRIGDVVTVGDISGTVTRIRARATTVTDFDNKEVLIPNKSFITDRVINWTLSNQTTRLLLKMSVPVTTDATLAQRVMLETVQRNPDVLRQPAPSVFIAGFGDSSLEFEIRAFVDVFDKRQTVQHDINVALAGALRANGIEIATGSA